MKPTDLWRPLIALAVLAAPATAWAQTDTGHGGGLAWLTEMFQFRYPDAFDYIALVAAPLLGVTVAVFHYRAVLLDAVKDMQRPASVKLRSTGLGIVTAALILMVAPGLPVGWLLILLIVGALLAFRFGLSILIAAALLVVAIIIIAVKASHILH